MTVILLCGIRQVIRFRLFVVTPVKVMSLPEP